MILRLIARPLCGAVCVLCCLGYLDIARAQNIPVPHYEEESKPDETIPLPPFPKPENLIRFPTSWTSNEVYIDGSTLVFGDGEVLSYTLVVKGAGGAQNVSFESLRCTTAERRVLAYGRSDGTWSRARASDWKPIEDSGINRYYFEFWRDTFCSGKTLERKRDLLDNIKRGGRERPFNMPTE